jgi:hypothetical protein
VPLLVRSFRRANIIYEQSRDTTGKISTDDSTTCVLSAIFGPSGIATGIAGLASLVAATRNLNESTKRIRDSTATWTDILKLGASNNKSPAWHQEESDTATKSPPQHIDHDGSKPTAYQTGHIVDFVVMGLPNWMQS